MYLRDVMFPLNLHKNILQLDRQISLLENECKQMDLDNRKNNGLLKQSHSNKCSKTLNAHVKPPSSKVLTKKACESGKTKKLSPVVPSRVDSTSSVPSYCGKQHNRVCDSMVLNQATNPKGVNSKFYQCSCCDTKNNRFYTLQQKHTKCNCGNKDLSENCLNSLQFGEKSDCILHKEVLLSKPGSSIEVTVKQKPSCAVQKENFSFTNLSDKATKEVESCGCLIKKNKKALGQKWSEILSVEPNKQNRESNCISGNIIFTFGRL